jgi:hypothetical protein
MGRPAKDGFGEDPGPPFLLLIPARRDDVVFKQKTS